MLSRAIPISYLTQLCALKVLILISFLPIMGAIFSNSKCRESTIDGKINADCSRRGLINIVDSNVDPAARILDMSHNELIQIRAHMFEGIDNLEELNFQSNMIERIFLQAFQGLVYLNKLDLSHNRISNFDLLFYPALISLNISFNPLIHTTMSCKTLQVLDISSCKLSETSFSDKPELPNLQHLNMSFNFITKMHFSFIHHMPLQTFQIHKNPLTCNRDIDDLIAWLTAKNVQFSSICGSINYPTSTLLELTSPKSILMPTNNKIELDETSEQQQQSQMFNDRLEEMRLEQKLFAVLILTLLLVILILLAVFMVIYCYFLKRNKKQELPEIDIDEDIPPPPYRTYMSGFSI